MKTSFSANFVGVLWRGPECLQLHHVNKIKPAAAYVYANELLRLCFYALVLYFIVLAGYSPLNFRLSNYSPSANNC